MSLPLTEEQAEMRILLEEKMLEKRVLIGEGSKGDYYSLGDNNQYVFYFSQDGDEEYHEWDMPIREVAAACRWYCNPRGLSRKEVAERLFSYFGRQIDDDYLKRLFVCLGINKSSNGLSPHHYLLDEKEFTEALMLVKKEKLDIVAEDDAAHWRKMYTALAQEKANQQDIVKQISDSISKVDIEINVPTTTRIRDDIDRVLVLTDWHTGAHVNEVYNTFNAEVMQERVSILMDSITKYGARQNEPTGKLHIVGLGDMIESIAGNMRDGQHEEMELFGIDQATYGGSLYVRVIKHALEVFQPREFEHNGIGGNHGRVSPSRDQDPSRVGDGMFYAIAKASLPERLQEMFHVHKGSSFMLKIRGASLHCMHGDRSNPKAYNTFLAYDIPRPYMLLSGHLHSYYHEEVHRGIYRTRAGCLIGATPYSADSGYSSDPSQMLIEVDNEGFRTPISLRCS